MSRGRHRAVVRDDVRLLGPLHPLPGLLCFYLVRPCRDYLFYFSIELSTHSLPIVTLCIPVILALRLYPPLPLIRFTRGARLRSILNSPSFYLILHVYCTKSFTLYLPPSPVASNTFRRLFTLPRIVSILHSVAYRQCCSIWRVPPHCPHLTSLKGYPLFRAFLSTLPE